METQFFAMVNGNYSIWIDGTTYTGFKTRQEAQTEAVKKVMEEINK